MQTFSIADKMRCPWCGTDPLYVKYHDEEWGVPVHNDQKHFEFLVLESAQTGLSWLTVLRKRENYRKALDGFDAENMSTTAPENKDYSEYYNKHRPEKSPVFKW
jgi:DNA-3-methyladenine glycosylase I